jgi:hypothetical protein
MEYFDKEYYEDLININKLNKQIQILSLEIKDYTIKKENNMYFLNIQNNLFTKLFNKKYVTLKKYYIMEQALGILRSGPHATSVQ